MVRPHVLAEQEVEAFKNAQDRVDKVVVVVEEVGRVECEVLVEFLNDLAAILGMVMVGTLLVGSSACAAPRLK